ncbi:hypothetical protein ABIA32_000780 [Streptacidiphilus sp. MAP12-20]|uniref:hypothetical protein n=1 Tax=Streptacidiphilus sp. MAP12-20 TaxID=3156299 RepID=UPI0035126E7A
MRSATKALLALLLVGLALLGAAARAHRPAPFGDTVAASSNPRARAVAADALRTVPGGEVQAYDRRSGLAAWSYRREGSVPLRLVTVARTTVAVWDDGMLTGVLPEPAAVRWHRFVPGVSGRTPLLLVPLGAGETFLVMTSDLVMTYNTVDGTIRTSTLPSPGCSYTASGLAGPVHVGEWVVVQRSCGEAGTAGAAGGSELEGFSPDGRRWQRPGAALRLRPAAGGGGVGEAAEQVAVLAVPWREPYLLDPASGHYGRNAFAPPVRLA